jgi:hypothetical protein
MPALTVLRVKYLLVAHVPLFKDDKSRYPKIKYSKGLLSITRAKP